MVDNGRQLQVVGLKPLENNLEWLKKTTVSSEIRFLENAEQDRQYVFRKTERRSRNHCCSGKAISIKYCECVSVFLS